MGYKVPVHSGISINGHLLTLTTFLYHNSFLGKTKIHTADTWRPLYGGEGEC